MNTRKLLVVQVILALLLYAYSPGRSAGRFILDSHYHARDTEEWVQKTVEVYRRHNAMCCTLTPMSNFALVKKAIQDYPDVFIGYGQVKPDDPNAVREIEEFYRAGFVGIKFHSPEKNWDDEKYFQLYRTCESLGLVMLFHTGITGRFGVTDKPVQSSSARMRPIYLDLIARAFPRTIVQGAHFGNPWFDEAAEACRWNPNLYFDISGSSLIKLEMTGQLDIFRKILWWAKLGGKPGAFEHIVFGSDTQVQMVEEKIGEFERFLEANQVPEEIREGMWGLTLARFLDLDPQTHRFKRPRPLPPGSYPFNSEDFKR